MGELSNDSPHNLVATDSKSNLARDMFVHHLEKNAAKNKANNGARKLFAHHLSELSNDSPHNLVATDSKSNLDRVMFVHFLEKNAAKNAAKNKANVDKELFAHHLSELSNDSPHKLVGTDSKSNLAKDMLTHFLEKQAAKNKIHLKHLLKTKSKKRTQENKNDALQPVKVSEVFPQHLLKTKSKKTRQVA